MGLFLFVAAVLSNEPLKIAASIEIFLEGVGFNSKVKNATRWREEIKNRSHFDVIDPPALTAIFPPKNDFCCISFDNCPFEEIEVSRHLSHQLNTVVSLIEVYDSSTWYHRLFQNGELIDRFCNNPSEFEGVQKANEFEGNADTLSNIFKVDKLEIQDYLFQFTPNNYNSNFSRKIKMSDEYTLGNEWFFTEFWKKLGIEYPRINPQLILFHKIK
jgi:hypothetical protein